MKRILAICLALMLSTAALAAPAALAEVVYASTPLDSASSDQLNNIELAVSALNGAFVPSGDAFSFNDTVGPRTASRGYVNAINGRGVKAMGGGVSQVAATLYLALKELGGVDYLEKKTYGSKFTGDYVSSGSDAIVTDYNEDIDFRFRNNNDDLSISIWTTGSAIECSLATGGDSGDDEGDYDEDYGSEPGTSGFAQFYLDGSSALKNNIELAAGAINGIILGHGDTFSFNDIVGARTESRGYESAVNGRGVKVVGGGVAQVASVIWLAIKDMGVISVVEKSTYGDRYNQSYVYNEDDAILTDYNDDIDFRFRYNGYGELTVHTYVVDDNLTCEIYEN